MNYKPILGDRGLFPSLSQPVYINHASVSPPSVVVVDAINKALLDYAKWGLDGIFPWIDQREVLRADIAKLIKAKSEEIGFIPNTTTGMIHIANCLQWKREDRIVLLHGEFPSNVIPWQQVANRFHLKVEFVQADDFRVSADRTLSQLEDLLKKGVRLLAVSAVQFQTGFQMPLSQLGKLCRRYDTLFFVDGVQACGAVPIDVHQFNIDFLSCGSHKWLMGVEGCGFLFIRQGCLPQLKPYTAGWLSHENTFDFLMQGSGLMRYDKPFKPNASFVEGGAVSVIGFAGLGASVKLLLELGVENIFSHINSYLDILEQELTDLGFVSLRSQQGRSGILSVENPTKRTVEEVTKILGKNGIACSMPDGKLRFSPHWPNAFHEIEMVVHAVRCLLQ